MKEMLIGKMNRIEEFILKGMRKAYQKLFLPSKELPPCEMDPDKASEMIYQLLVSDEPCMVARFGSTELSCLTNYMGIIDKSNSVWKYITGQTEQWWWNKNIANQMQQWSGFFPPTEENLTKFSELMLSDMRQVDLLGSWIPDEHKFENYLQKVKFVRLTAMEPCWSKHPWSRVLEGKRVLVVHPFAEDICRQYDNNRERLFDNPDVLPEFSSLRVIKAVQSLGGEDNGFKNWFEALEWMKLEIDKEDYDIALIGCGAYGFPLAAHVKRTGKKAVHLGGALQLLFGIKGKRWENSGYNLLYNYTSLFNNYWVYPNKSTKPQNAEEIEGGCYW